MGRYGGGGGGRGCSFSSIVFPAIKFVLTLIFTQMAVVAEAGVDTAAGVDIRMEADRGAETRDGNS